MGKLSDKAKAAAERKFPKTVKTVKTVRKVSNDAKSVVNGRCGNCGTALRGGSCPKRGCWDLGLSCLCFTSFHTGPSWAGGGTK